MWLRISTTAAAPQEGGCFYEPEHSDFYLLRQSSPSQMKLILLFKAYKPQTDFA